MGAKNTILNRNRLVTILAEERETSNRSIWQAITKACEEQAEVTWLAREPEIEKSHKSGMEEVADWIEHNLIYITQEVAETPKLILRNNGYKLAKKWEEKKRAWGLKER